MFAWIRPLILCVFGGAPDPTAPTVIDDATSLTSAPAASEAQPGSEVQSGDKSSSLLALPDRLIVRILALLPTADRLRARRASRKLYALEAGQLYGARSLYVGPPRHPKLDAREDIAIRMTGPRDRYVDCIQKIANNIQLNRVFFLYTVEQDRPLIASFNALSAVHKQVNFCSAARTDPWRRVPIPSHQVPMGDANLHEWVGQATYFSADNCGPLTGDRLFMLFGDMQSGRVPLRSFKLKWGDREAYIRLLDLIGLRGVTIQAPGSLDNFNRHLFSANRDVEVYRQGNAKSPPERPPVYAIVVGGTMIINVTIWIWKHAVIDCLSIQRHNEDGSLPRAWCDRYTTSISEVREEARGFVRVPIEYRPSGRPQHQ